MALVVTLDKAAYKVGDTITATLSLTGPDVVPDIHKTVVITGTASVDGAAPIAATATYDLVTAGTHSHVFNMPGFTAPSANSLVWTGKA